MLESSLEVIIVGSVLIVGIFLYGWIEYRRTIRIGNFGLAMVKNRLNESRQSHRPYPRRSS